MQQKMSTINFACLKRSYVTQYKITQLTNTIKEVTVFDDPTNHLELIGIIPKHY